MKNKRTTRAENYKKVLLQVIIFYNGAKNAKNGADSLSEYEKIQYPAFFEGYVKAIKDLLG